MKYLLPLFLLALFACDEAPVDNNTEATVTTTSVDMAANPDSLLRHVVLFSFKEDSYPAGVAEVEAAFRALPSQISAIHGFEWGTNNSPEGINKGFTHCYFLTFKSEADRDTYLPHPAHKRFGEIVGPHLADVLVVDYWTQD
ncbi:MAG: Dabb family protein [Bacteroidota bacterium]